MSLIFSWKSYYSLRNTSFIRNFCLDEDCEQLLRDLRRFGFGLTTGNFFVSIFGPVLSIRYISFMFSSNKRSLYSTSVMNYFPFPPSFSRSSPACSYRTSYSSWTLAYNFRFWWSCLWFFYTRLWFTPDACSTTTNSEPFYSSLAYTKLILYITARNKAIPMAPSPERYLAMGWETVGARK